MVYHSPQLQAVRRWTHCVQTIYLRLNDVTGPNSWHEIPSWWRHYQLIRIHFIHYKIWDTRLDIEIGWKKKRLSFCRKLINDQIENGFFFWGGDRVFFLWEWFVKCALDLGPGSNFDLSDMICKYYSFNLFLKCWN